MRQGFDAALLPQSDAPQVWKRGAVEEVAFGVWANHGGGYYYRMCAWNSVRRGEDGDNSSLPWLTEECFQHTSLLFAGDTQWLQHVNGTRTEIPMLKVANGTSPAGSVWARLPFPQCNKGKAGTPGDPDNHGYNDDCATNGTAFPEPLPGLHGFGYASKFHEYSVVDKIVVPDHLPDGDYLLSWRWDSEQTSQIWQVSSLAVLSHARTCCITDPRVSPFVELR
jgi:hypothetical protein